MASTSQVPDSPSNARLYATKPAVASGNCASSPNSDMRKSGTRRFDRKSEELQRKNYARKFLFFQNLKYNSHLSTHRRRCRANKV